MRYSKQKKQRIGLWHILGMAIVVGIVAYTAFMNVYRMDKPLQHSGVIGDGLSALANCLAESGARMYGASWCPHCVSQKQEFGESIEQVPYVECAVDGNSGGQAQECVKARISSYPTWVFADGSRLTGERPLWELARKSGCEWEG
jgi:glutaredoxin